MQPMGRKFYKDKTGGKHTLKNSKKYPSWWEDICKPSKKTERQQVKREIEMKVTIEIDTDEAQQADELKTIVGALDMRIALWDTDKLLARLIKYENQLHDGYLTEEEEKVVEYIQKQFQDILEEQDVTKLVLDMP